MAGLARTAGALAYPGATWHVEGDHYIARTLDGTIVGWAGRLPADAPPWGGALFGAEVDVSATLRPPVRVRPLLHTPAVERDLSLIVADGIAADAIQQVVVAKGGPLLESVRVIAEYRGESLGEGRRSVTFRMTFRSPDRTLRDADVDAAEREVLAALDTQLGLKRRGT